MAVTEPSRVRSGPLDQTPSDPPEDSADHAGPSRRASERAQSPREPRRPRQFLRYTLPGAWVALVVCCLAFTPSLLPRSGMLQGVVCGITAAIGYGIGVLGAAVWRAFADRDQRPASRTAWRRFAVVAVVALLGSFLLGERWQGQIRDIMGVPAPGLLVQLLLPLTAAVLFILIIGLGRGLRGLYRRSALLLARWIGPRAARGVGWVLVVGLTYSLASGVLGTGLVAVANQTFSAQDRLTKDSVVRPNDSLRSGGPESIVPWDELGQEGRTFVARGPSAQDIITFTGASARTPIRAYAGVTAADDVEERARLAVDDLQRAGGFNRAYLLVASGTGSGWIDPAAIDAFEYMTGGDSAVVGMQYSFLPSWISYLVDADKAKEAGRELFDTVYARWSKLPEDGRPKLMVFGESLGSFGGETAFSGEYDMHNRTSGVLFAGPPNFNTLYRSFVDHRDPGSTEVQPTYKTGRTVRFQSQPGAEVAPVGEPWQGTRVLYLQHASDPIVWWSPDLLTSEPDWLDEPLGRDVPSDMVWIPLVTFWQVAADLPLARGVPDGHGHTYGAEYVDAWASVMKPPGWTAAKADQLRALIARIPE